MAIAEWQTCRLTWNLTDFLGAAVSVTSATLSSSVDAVTVMSTPTMKTAVPAFPAISFVNGVLTSNGQPYVDVVATQDPDISPTNFTLTLTVLTAVAGNRPAQTLVATFQTPVGGNLDLATMLPVKASTGDLVYRKFVSYDNSAASTYTDEQAQDAVAAALAAGTHSNITVTYNDSGNAISLSGTPNTVYTDEQAQDTVAAMFAAGTHQNITVTYNDANNSISLVGSASGSGTTVYTPGYVFRDAYNSATTYGANDGVTQVINGETVNFVATAGVTGVAPGSATSPASPWKVFARGGAGAQGVPGTGAAGVATPAAQGFKGWTFDPAAANTNNIALVNGRLNVARMHLPACTPASVQYNVNSAGSALTAGTCFVALYNATSGDLLSLSADMASEWASGGMKVTNFASTAAWAGGEVYVAFLSNGTTGPTLTTGSGDTALSNFRNVNVASVRAGLASPTSGVTSMPSNLNIATLSGANRNFLAGVA